MYVKFKAGDDCCMCSKYVLFDDQELGLSFNVSADGAYFRATYFDPETGDFLEIEQPYYFCPWCGRELRKGKK